MKHSTNYNLECKDHDDRIIEIDFLIYFKIIKAEKNIILLTILISILIGGFYAIYSNSKPEFEAIGKIMPEVAIKPDNGLGGLYEVLKKYGSNTDMYNTDITRPEIYGEIINTKTFYDYLLLKNVKTVKGKKLLFKTYYYANLAPENSITEHEKNVDRKLEYFYQQNIQSRIKINNSKNNNVVSVYVKMPDPVVAANIANFTIDYLIEFITKYRTEKAHQELLFVEKLIDETLKTDISKEVKTNLLTSSIQMKIKIQEDTPVIQVLENAQIPMFKSNKSNILIMSPFIFFGFIAGMVIALFKNRKHIISLR